VALTQTLSEQDREIPGKKPLDLLINFFTQLNTESIRYCHWKSTCRLADGLAGNTDLDLLLDRTQSQQLRQILAHLDFKPVLSAPHRQFPAIEDYLGMDRASGRLAHLHVHYRLVLGEQYVKNYYLPVADCFFSNTRLMGSVRIPIPELELVVFVLRCLLKYRDRDLLRDLVKQGQTGLPPGRRAELAYLRAQADAKEIGRVLTYFPFLSSDLVFEFLELTRRTPRAGTALYALRRRTRKQLAPYQRYSRVQARAKYYAVLFSRSRLRPAFFSRRSAGKKKTPGTGGISLAFTGSDGAGKSTMTRSIMSWLSWRLEARVFYMGNTTPSAVNRFIRNLRRLSVRLERLSARKLGRSAASLFARCSMFCECLRYVADGVDRYRRYEKGRKWAATGGITLYDRYPLPQLKVMGRPMDGPRIGCLESGQAGRIQRVLARLEESLYRRIQPPENLMVLMARPEVCLARKPGHRVSSIKAKTEAIGSIETDGMKVIRIDAEKPAEETLLDVKTALWQLF